MAISPVPPTGAMSPNRASDRLGQWTQPCIAVLAIVLFAIRMAGPSTLMDKDQERPAAYVLDILQNGHWLCPHDWTGEVASKPPLSVWTSAVISWVTGHVSLWALCLPGAIGIGGTALIMGAWGRRMWGGAAGLFAGATFLLSSLSIKLIALNRTDGLFTFTVVVTAVLAWRAWENGRGWIWFWLAGAAATLTKGPLGLILGAMGLLAELWERRRGWQRPVRGMYGWGIALYFLVTLGWFGAALADEGPGIARKMLGQELAGHVMDPSFGFWGRGFFLAPAYLMSRFLPWSPIALLGLVQVWRSPASGGAERRFERFLALWLVGGLAILALATHQRGDLVAPLFPPAALLAGRLMASWTRRLSGPVLGSSITAVCVAGLLIAWGSYRSAAHTSVVQQSEGMRELACKLHCLLPPGEKLLVVDAPFALQTHLNQFQKPVSYEYAAGVMQSDHQVMVAVKDLPHLLRLFPAETAPHLEVVAAWPAVGEPWVQIVRRELGPAGSGSGSQ